MDRSEKLAVARRKLKKFQARGPAANPAGSVVAGTDARFSDGLPGIRWATMMPSTPPVTTVAPSSDSPTPPQTKSAKLSSTESLREMSQEISQLLSRSAIPTSAAVLPVHHQAPPLDHTPPLGLQDSPSNHSDTMAGGSAHLADGERSSLQRQIQVHAQTIDVLVAEKSTLQSERAAQQRLLEEKKRECLKLNSDLQAARQSLQEVEREKEQLAEELTRREKTSTHSDGQLTSLRQTVEGLRSSLEEQRQENTELISKVTSQAGELAALLEANTELQSKLNMSELLAQQLSSGGPPAEAPPPDPTFSQVEELRGEVETVRLRAEQLREERDQALSDVTALRDTMMVQQEEGAKKLSKLQSSLAEADVRISSLTSEVDQLQMEEGSLKERLSSESADVRQSSLVAMETLQHERDQLQHQLECQVRDNAQLSQLNQELEEQVYEKEEELGRVREAAVDQRSLLTAMHQDKETISRAMSQNKELKANLVELQDAFVRLSQQNMQLATELESERHQVRELSRLKGEEEVGEEEGEMRQEERGEGEALVVEGVDSEESQQLLALQCERDSLLGQLHGVKEEYAALREDKERVLRELDEARQGRREEDPIGHEMEVQNLTLEELTTLQNNFNALQQRFTAVMSEKARLLERLEEEEHRILQLSGETETIGEYVALYQMQREALRAKFMEKDQFIQQLTAEREAMQAKLSELQNLVRQLLSERPSHHTPKPLPPSHHKPRPPSPPPSDSPADIPFHLKPQPTSHTPSPTDNGDHTPSFDDSAEDGVPEATVEQIMSLLDELGSRVVHGEEFVPCACCTGQLIAV